MIVTFNFVTTSIVRTFENDHENKDSFSNVPQSDYPPFMYIRVIIDYNELTNDPFWDCEV